MLRPDGRDTWFEFRPNDPSSVQTAADAIRDLYTEVGEAWLHRFSTLASLRDELARTGQTWWAAAASLCAGDSSEAAVLLHKAIDSAPRDIAPHLVHWGKQNALV